MWGRGRERGVKGGIWVSCEWICTEVLILSPPLWILSVWLKATAAECVECMQDVPQHKTQTTAHTKQGLLKIPSCWRVMNLASARGNIFLKKTHKKKQCNLRRRRSTWGKAVYLATRANHQRPQLKARLIWAYWCNMNVSNNSTAWICVTHTLKLTRR